MTIIMHNYALKIQSGNDDFYIRIIQDNNQNTTTFIQIRLESKSIFPQNTL